MLAAVCCELSFRVRFEASGLGTGEIAIDCGVFGELRVSSIGRCGLGVWIWVENELMGRYKNREDFWRNQCELL